MRDEIFCQWTLINAILFFIFIKNSKAIYVSLILNLKHKKKKSL